MTTPDPSPVHTPLFTCITCRVAFKDPEIQRSHYKTDWHRYNLKRKVAELTPVAATAFQEKVLTQREAAVVENKRRVCKICRKHFTSHNSYDCHLRSKKHHDMVSAAEKQKVKSTDSQKSTEEIITSKPDEEEEEEEVLTDPEPEPLEITECLFCPHESKDMECSLSHMSMIHGFFIPDLDYLVDFKGLISYLCEKVGIYYTCLYCNERGKNFSSVESVQQHMVDKGHCKIFFEFDAALEYAEFYDYSKSYPDHMNRAEESPKIEEEGIENRASNESEEHDVPEREVEINDDLELVLPSGSKASHRAMRYYFKQHLPTQDQRKSTLITRLMSQYRALGWKNDDRRQSGILQQKSRSWATKMQNARALKLGVKANKFQPHFRPQVVF